jgi:hypothetical protein
MSFRVDLGDTLDTIIGVWTISGNDGSPIRPTLQPETAAADPYKSLRVFGICVDAKTKKQKDRTSCRPKAVPTGAHTAKVTYCILNVDGSMETFMGRDELCSFHIPKGVAIVPALVRRIRELTLDHLVAGEPSFEPVAYDSGQQSFVLLTGWTSPRAVARVDYAEPGLWMDQLESVGIDFGWGGKREGAGRPFKDNRKRARNSRRTARDKQHRADAKEEARLVQRQREFDAQCVDLVSYPKDMYVRRCAELVSELAYEY